MISKERVLELVDEVIAEKGAFLVDLSVSKGNKIKVLIDKQDGLSINDCVQVSRFVENKLNRDEEDFDLEVSSPGVSEPLKVRQQYPKNVGRIVEVTTIENEKHKGKLLNVSNEGVVIEETKKVKVEGSKKKKTITEHVNIAFSEIDKTKVLISFK